MFFLRLKNLEGKDTKKNNTVNYFVDFLYKR